MSKTQIYLVAGVLVVCSAYALYVRFSTLDEKQFHDPTVCSVCKKKLPEKDAPCPWCQAQKIQDELKAAKEGSSAKRGLSTVSKLTITIGGSLVIFAIAFWPQIRNHMRARNQLEKYFVIRCAQCGRKLRYAITSGGKKGMCPSCLQVFTFPPLGDETRDAS